MQGKLTPERIGEIERRWFGEELGIVPDWRAHMPDSHDARRDIRLLLEGIAALEAENAELRAQLAEVNAPWKRNIPLPHHAHLKYEDPADENAE